MIPTPAELAEWEQEADKIPYAWHKELYNHENMSRHLVEWGPRIIQLCTALQSLRERLERYGQHIPHCDFYKCPPCECSCGLEELA